MEAKLHLSPAWGTGAVYSQRGDGTPNWRESHERYEDHGVDEQAARRWASLRAAAQIGRDMP